MKIKSPIIDSRSERQIITGMIVSTKFLKEIKPILRPDLFQLNFAKIIAEWCLDYYDKYKISPKKDIESIFSSFKSKLPEERIDTIASFLESISEEYKRAKNFNVDYILDKTEKYLRKTSLYQLNQKLKEVIIREDIDEGEKLLANFRRISRISNISVDPINDMKTIRSAFSIDSSQNMFTLPGDLGALIGPFQREWLVSIVANSGIGKTWWLMFIAVKATLAGYNVVFVTLEMSSEEMIRRIQYYLNAGASKNYLDGIIIPVFDCKSNQDNSCNLKYRKCKVGIKGEEEEEEEVKFEDAPKKYFACTSCRYKKNNQFKQTVWFRKIKRDQLTITDISKKTKKMRQLNFISGNLRLVHYPMGTLSIRKLETYLDNLEYYEGFVPDVIVTDYASKFGSDDKYDQKRFNIQEVWEGHKMIAQKRKLLAISGHQGNTVRTGGDVGQGGWAEDISGFHLSDISIALNQTPDEKEKGIMRTSVIKRRSDDFSVLNEAKVLYSYKIGRPYLDSYLSRKSIF